MSACALALWAPVWFEPLTPVEQLRLTPLLIYGVLDVGLAGAFFAIWRTAPAYRVFRSMGIYLSLFGFVMLWAYRGGQSTRWFWATLTAPVLVVIAGEAMHVERRRWTWIVWPICLPFLIGGWFPATRFLQNGMFEITQIMLGILIVQALRQRVARDRAVILVFLLLFLVRWTASPLLAQVWKLPGGLNVRGWQWSFNSAAMIALGTATLVIYGRALLEHRRQRQRLEAELAASRAVQELLIPAQQQLRPGLRIEAAYRPFSEVGGDFFQVIPCSRSTLIAIGDVSGKGMPAALMVSLLIGTLHALAETTDSPAAILAGLNRRALGHSHGGFTTCLVVRIDVDGGLTAANAGHLAPYLNGAEFDLENALPLGLDANATYAESALRLKHGDRLVLMTDGVVEARNATGGLFGFERTAGLCGETAEVIARTAEEFGQEDDITVLSVTRATT
jgi:hypothetical protein